MEYIREALDSILEEENEEMSFDSFLDKAEVILVDNAFDFDINKWEKENQEEIDEELSEDTNNKTDTTTSQFIKYQLTPDQVKEIVNKIINSDFNIINYWKTNQFKKKNNLTDDDLKDILRTLTEQDYKTNSISSDNSKNEAIIFIKQTNIKNLSNIKVYIKLDYDSIENSPVIVLSFHSKREKTQLISSYKNIGNLKEDAEQDKPDYLDKLGLKSNGIYSLNTGWVKRPVQQDIPDIDEEAFDKLFTEWEDRYFDLIKEDEVLTENQDNLTEYFKGDRRYYIRPQNIFCSSKEDILKALIKLGNKDCTIYTLKNLKDNDDLYQLGNRDIIYYYHNGMLYDKNKVKVMDYDLLIKNEENRKRFINIEKVPDEVFDQVYQDRLTEFLKEDEEISKADKINDFISDLYDLRKTSIANEGEYGLGNLVFKEFRNLGYLDNLKELRKKEITKELSLEQLNK